MASVVEPFAEQLRPEIAPKSTSFQAFSRDLAPDFAAVEVAHALALALPGDPEPRTSLLREVEFAGARAALHFERGDGSLAQQTLTGARGVRLLPLPFLATLRAFATAAQAWQVHAERSVLRAGLSAHAVVTVHGEARLNAAMLEPRAGARPREAPAASLASALGACLLPEARIFARGIVKRSLRQARPLLPDAVVRFVDHAALRISAGSDFDAELGLFASLARRMQGKHAVWAGVATRSRAEIIELQLALLPAVQRLCGAFAVDEYFAQRSLSGGTKQAAFRASLSAWRSERRLPELARAEENTLRLAQKQRAEESRARVHQARHELARGKAQAALLLAIDAACMSPEDPAVWLALGEIRGAARPGSRALCFAEAVCAARGEPGVIAAVKRQLAIGSDSALAAYFRGFGDEAVAAWLEASATSSELSN